MLSRSTILWFVAWLATLAVVVWMLTLARQRVIATLGSPEAQADWQRWREEEAARQADPGAPVRRRMPKSLEPPALVLMRDHFPAIVAMSLLVTSVCFGFAVLTFRGYGRNQRTDDKKMTDKKMTNGDAARTKEKRGKSRG